MYLETLPAFTQCMLSHHPAVPLIQQVLRHYGDNIVLNKELAEDFCINYIQEEK